MRFSSCFFHAAWCSAAVMVLLRRCSSGSVSKADVPSSVRPSRVAAPAANSSASATVVFPAPPWPTMATSRSLPTSLATSSAGIPSSVTFVDNAQAVEGEELVDGLDAGRFGRDERGEPAGGEHARARIVLVADALDEPVDERGGAVDHARLDGVHG